MSFRMFYLIFGQLCLKCIVFYVVFCDCILTLDFTPVICLPFLLCNIEIIFCFFACLLVCLLCLFVCLVCLSCLSCFVCPVCLVCLVLFVLSVLFVMFVLFGFQTVGAGCARNIWVLQVLSRQLNKEFNLILDLHVFQNVLPHLRIALFEMQRVLCVFCDLYFDS